MRLPSGYAFELSVVILGDVLVGYLTVEALEAFTGVRDVLLPSQLLAVLGRLNPIAAGSLLTVILISFSGILLYWFWRFTPVIHSKYLGGRASHRQSEPVPAEEVMKAGEFQFSQNAETQPFVDVFPIEGYKLNVYAAVTKEEGREGFKYMVLEPTLSSIEKAQLDEIKKLLVDELEVDLRSIETKAKAEQYLAGKVEVIAKRYRYNISPDSMTKLLYYLSRDFIRLGKIEPLMRDKLIEDISCDGANIPIYIWYRDYESIPSNIGFETEEELDTFVSKLAYSAGKQISLAEPIVDASLPDGSRLHLTYGKEITQRGSTFTIRKFRADPLTIVDLIKYNTMSSELAAYLWYLIEKKLALLVAGGTASGKSVPYDEKVLIYRDGKPLLVPIGKLYDEEEALSRRSRKESQYDIIDCEKIETAAFDFTLKVKKFPVKSIIRHAAPEKIYAVRTRSGRVVRATGDHSVFVIVDGNVTPFPTSQLTPGMFVALPRTIPGPQSASVTINLLDLLARDDDQMYAENVAEYLERAVEAVGEDEAARLLSLRPRDLRSGIHRGFIAVRVERLHALAAAAKIPIDASRLEVRPKTSRRFKLPAILPVTKSFARLMGYWTAEGMYQKGITLFQLDEGTRRDMITSSVEALGLTGIPNPGDKTRLDFNSTAVRAVFKKIFGGGRGAGSKRIPELVFEQPNDILAEFLRGYFTGDAWVGSTIEASTKSVELSHQLQYALSRFNIVARVSPKIVKGVTYYRISIYGQKNLKRFADEIGFPDRARQERLAQSAQEILAPHTNLDTVPGIAGILKEALAFKRGKEKKQLRSDWHSYWSPTKRKAMGRQTLVSFVSETGVQGDLEEKLLSLAYSDIFWDEVAEVEEVEYHGKFVYDLEVPGAENFVGGSGGVFLHNTTTLNALSMFIEPGQKVVSVEDTPELNLPHENWVQSVTRGVGTAGEITMFDLLKASLRQRPDIIIVGEVRGQEAYTLLQTIATGHGGLGTIHADSVEAVINRLTTEPMNIPRSLVGSTLDCIAMQLKIRLADKSVRRVVGVSEVVGHDARTGDIILNDVFKWDPVADKFTSTGRSKLFDKITQRFGTKPEEIRRDIDWRKIFLDWLVAKNIRSHTAVSEQVKEFYGGPSAMVNKARVELEARPE